jgi:cellobiose-specific phosphotransferase system component IIC
LTGFDPQIGPLLNSVQETLMHALVPPTLAALIWIGGGGLGLILVIVVVLLVLRR